MPKHEKLQELEFQGNSLNSNALNVFNYEGATITFQTTEKNFMLINATEMSKKFVDSKKPDNFLRNKQTQEYINALSHFSNLRSDDIVVVRNGGNNRGTWFHELLAVRFAQWLSPEFSIWVDTKLKELLLKGKTELPKTKIAEEEKTATLRYDIWVKEIDTLNLNHKKSIEPRRLKECHSIEEICQFLKIKPEHAEYILKNGVYNELSPIWHIWNNHCCHVQIVRIVIPHFLSESSKSSGIVKYKK